MEVETGAGLPSVDWGNLLEVASTKRFRRVGNKQDFTLKEAKILL